jgi:hypothetical protein
MSVNLASVTVGVPSVTDASANVSIQKKAPALLGNRHCSFIEESCYAYNSILEIDFFSESKWVAARVMTISFSFFAIFAATDRITTVLIN